MKQIYFQNGGSRQQLFCVVNTKNFHICLIGQIEYCDIKFSCLLLLIHPAHGLQSNTLLHELHTHGSQEPGVMGSLFIYVISRPGGGSSKVNGQKQIMCREFVAKIARSGLCVFVLRHPQISRDFDSFSNFLKKLEISLGTIF